MFLRLSILLLSVILIASCESNKKNNSSKDKLEKVKEKYKADILAFKKSVDLISGLIESKASKNQLQKAFLNARLHYKKIEFITEYYNPVTAKSINGPALEEVEEDDPLKTSIPPEGLQVIEEYLFPNYNPALNVELQKEVDILNSNINRIIKTSEGIQLTDAHVFDAIKMELIRLMSLGLSGFDSPLANHSIPEAEIVLSSLKKYLNFYTSNRNKVAKAELDLQFSMATKALKQAISFSNFDRLHFIRDHLNSLSKSIHLFQHKSNIPFVKGIRAITSEATSIFEENAINPNYFTPGSSSYLTSPKIALGKLLFYDPVLSGNNKRSCASCHHPKRGFADGSEKSIAFDFDGRVNRNAPTILNAGLQSALFYDSRVMFLEDQANDVVTNNTEMHGSLEEAARTIRKSEEYLNLFKKAFPEENNAISEKTIKIALASFTRSLKSLNSDFDNYIRNEGSSLSLEQIQGFNVFMGKGKCGTCHFLPLFNGVVPPSYENTEAEVIGVPEKSNTLDAKVDSDVGKYKLNKIDKYKHAFKTPTLRNISLTSPYMHNGVFKTLEEVVEFYDKGGGAGLGINLPNQTLPTEKLNLTSKEKKQLVAFMESLTDTTGLTSVPKYLPKFSDKKLSRRKVGGEY